MSKENEIKPLKQPIVTRCGFKKGDKVEIVGNIPYHLKNEKRPLCYKFVD